MTRNLQALQEVPSFSPAFRARHSHCLPHQWGLSLVSTGTLLSKDQGYVFILGSVSEFSRGTSLHTETGLSECHLSSLSQPSRSVPGATLTLTWRNMDTDPVRPLLTAREEAAFSLSWLSGLQPSCCMAGTSLSVD